jgi:hypothetical protein
VGDDQEGVHGRSASGPGSRRHGAQEVSGCHRGLQDRRRAYNLANQPDNAIAAADRAMAVPDVNPAIKQVAAAEKERAAKAKAGK